MLLTFLYHRTQNGKNANSIELIKSHLEYVAKKYTTVLPGEKLNPFKLNICLTFDDGFYDFYHYVFPLLKKLKIKAILAIPVKFILETTNLAPEIRLNVSSKEAVENDIYKIKAPFCTWQEIKEMHDSNLVQIASHSYSHKNLLDKEIDLDLELINSKKILEEKLHTQVDIFAYPLGKFNEEIHKEVKKYYKYIMRIGSAINFSWQNINSITYRIISDELKSKKENLKLKNYVSYFWFFFLNTFRKR